MDGGTVVTVSGATLIGEATGRGAVEGAAGAADDEAVAVAAAGAGAATAAGTGAESRAAHPSFPRKLINEARPDGRFTASLTAVDSTIFSGDAVGFWIGRRPAAEAKAQMMKRRGAEGKR